MNVVDGNICKNLRSLRTSYTDNLDKKKKVTKGEKKKKKNPCI